MQCDGSTTIVWSLYAFINVFPSRRVKNEKSVLSSYCTPSYC